MAGRQVYADPFGSYIQGYDTGVQRESQFQRGVRDVRDMDWNFYNMKPIELETAQRTNAFQTYADPYQRQMLPIGVQNAQNAAFMGDVKAAEVPAFYGITDPIMAAIAQQYGYGRVGTPGGTQFIGPNGEPVSPTITPDDVNSQYLRQERRDISNEDRDFALRQQAQQLQAQQIAAQLASQRQQMEEAYLRWGLQGQQGADILNWMPSLFGAPPTAPAPVAPTPTPAPVTPQAPAQIPPYLRAYP